MRIWRLSVGLLLFGTATWTLSAAGAEKERIPVTIAVSCDDESIKSELTSFVSRELRKIDDVQLYVEAPPSGGLMTLDVSAVPVCGNVGVAISFAMWLRWYPAPKDIREATDLNTPFVPHFLGHRMVTGPRDDMKKLSELLVTAFDTDGLNEWRRDNEEMRRAMDEWKNKNKHKKQ